MISEDGGRCIKMLYLLTVQMQVIGVGSFGQVLCLCKTLILLNFKNLQEFKSVSFYEICLRQHNGDKAWHLFNCDILPSASCCC